VEEAQVGWLFVVYHLQAMAGKEKFLEGQPQDNTILHRLPRVSRP
jgi:hypothetical protein